MKVPLKKTAEVFMAITPSKITIIGSQGSGKTTLAIKLGKSSGLPVFHLDKLLWDKGWVLRPRQDFIEDHQKLITQNKWIIEGTSRTTLDIRYPISDLVIFLNPPRLVCLFLAFKRFFLTRSQMSDKPEGCKEKITLDFLKYLWRFKETAVIQIGKLKEKYPEIRLIEITSIKDISRLTIETSDERIFP
ncbi:MAG: AAA family ATPase [Candidatus Paracaedibacter sp.]